MKPKDLNSTARRGCDPKAKLRAFVDLLARQAAREIYQGGTGVAFYGTATASALGTGGAS